MGAYNEVASIVDCPACGHAVPVNVQFKYGLCWQLKYKVGDLITPHDETKTTRAAAVVADGISVGECPSCGGDTGLDMFVFFEHDVITRVELADGRYNPLQTDKTYIVLAP
ncbi:hypothetical protein L6R49_23465 [Myxococcota bacterium]|nr:hypothetical protein [Myxococcota bacterium]